MYRGSGIGYLAYRLNAKQSEAAHPLWQHTVAGNAAVFREGYFVSTLSEEMCCWVVERTNAVIDRFLPDLRWPRHFVGCTPAAQDVACLAFLAMQLHELGVREIGGRSSEQIVSTALAQLDGSKTETFYSFFSAEALLAFGKFDDANPIVRGWNAEQRRSAIEAVDTTSIPPFFSSCTRRGW